MNNIEQLAHGTLFITLQQSSEVTAVTPQVVLTLQLYRKRTEK